MTQIKLISTDIPLLNIIWLIISPECQRKCWSG